MNSILTIDPDITLPEEDFRIMPHHLKWSINYLGVLAFYVSDNFDVKTCKNPQRTSGRRRKTEKILEYKGWRTIIGYHPSGWVHPYSSTVETYHTKEKALQGHEKWVNFMRDNRDIDPYAFEGWAYPGWIKKDQSVEESRQ